MQNCFIRKAFRFIARQTCTWRQCHKGHKIDQRKRQEGDRRSAKIRTTNNKQNLSTSPVPLLVFSLINFVRLVTLSPCISLTSNGAKSFADETILSGV